MVREDGRMTLTEFLLARFAEDEAAARAADPGPWHSWIEGRDGRGGDSVIFTKADEDLYVDIAQVRQVERRFNRNGVANQDHIARHDPARVLAECEAKRRLIAGFESGSIDDMFAPEILALLALPYADHPDYRQEWRP